MNLNLDNKTALVCGASKGIGKAVAYELASLGANVILMARSADLLIAAVADLPIKSANQSHQFVIGDSNNPVELHKKIKNLLQEININILINNTGGPASGPILNASPESFLEAFNQHLLASHLLTSMIVPGMKKTGYGRIINIISTSVKVPLKGLGVSNTIRGAVASWAKTLSSELGPFGITVNNVLPGATNTGRLQEIVRAKASKTMTSMEDVEKEMISEIPLNRFAQPGEVAAAVAFLASPSASYINGINLPVDGGRTGCL